ncbi:MAG: hypothetical protein SGILL_003981 [Bacillariaceae sp.]
MEGIQRGSNGGNSTSYIALEQQQQHPAETSKSIEQPQHDCIYVPGGGFSGFWFSLGRLQSLSAKDMFQEKFVCYSAGCLGVVATLLQHMQAEMSIADMGTHGSGSSRSTTASSSPPNNNNDHSSHLYNMARNIQVEWLNGDLHRYRIVESFVDGILESLEAMRDNDDPAVQAYYQRFFDIVSSNLYITTTSVPTEKGDDKALGGGASLKATLRQPSSIQDLKQMLLQTTWIPMATGSSFAHEGHLDGAFSALQHPSCARDVGLVVPRQNGQSWYSLLANTAQLFGNALNVNLGKQAVEDLWQMGLEYGV